MKGVDLLQKSPVRVARVVAARIFIDESRARHASSGSTAGPG
jgi:hypothetical protein